MFSKRILSSIITIALCVSILSTPSVFALNEITGGSDTSGTPNTNIPLYGENPNLKWQVSGSGTIPVHLYVPSGTLSMTTTDGLTFTGSPTGSSLYFSGSLNAVNAALATLQYNVSSNGTYVVELSLVEAGQIVYPATGHVYEVIDNGSGITANAARAAALARNYGGVSGYLANISSADENNFVAERLTGDGWFGASDAGAEGDWKWLDGPDAGTSFWSGTYTGGTVNSQYANWSSNEPNDYNMGNPGEDCAQFYITNGQWNDLPCSGTTLNYYVVEYGSTLLGGGPTSASDSLTVTVTADSTTQAPTLTSPASNSTQKTLQLIYSLTEAPLTGSVRVVFNNGTSTSTYIMSDSISVNTAVPLSSLATPSNQTWTYSTLMEDYILLGDWVDGHIGDGTYTVTLSYQDSLGNPASTDVATAVTIDTTANAPIVARPSNNETIQSTASTAEGTCETGATVSISNVHLQTNPTTVVCSGGTFSTSITFLSSGLNTPIALSFTQTDLAGNVSSATVKNIAYALQTGGGGGGGGQPKDEEKKIPTVTVVPEQNILPPINNGDKVPEKTIEAVPLNSAEEKTSCEVHEYLKNPIRLGAKNNPEDVKLLEQFLNKYENAGLTIDGIYSREDFNAVMKWQEKYADDILKPWGLKKGTGYVYIKSLAKIKEIEESSCETEETKK